MNTDCEEKSEKMAKIVISVNKTRKVEKMPTFNSQSK